MGRFRFGHWRPLKNVTQSPDRHSMAEVVRVPLDEVAAYVAVLEPAGIVATARTPEDPNADATQAAILVLAGEVDRAQYVLRRAGLLPEQ
jgi:hypothetical protein